MIFGIITLLLGVVTFIMFSQPVFAVYGSEAGATIFDKLGLNNNNCYNIIKFEKEQNTYLTVGNVFLILSMVLCGILMLLVLLNLIARATNNKSYVGCKIASILFFVCMLIATIMMVVYAAKDNSISNVIDSIKEGAPVVSIGYGLIVSLGCSLLTVIFSPMKKK